MAAKDTISGVKSSSPSSNLGSAPLRVLFVKDTLGHAGGLITGGTTYMFETLRSFDRKTIVPMLCILAPRHPAANQFEGIGIYPKFLSRKKWDPRALIDLLRILRQRNVHILHIEGKKSLILARIAALITGHPVIVHLHDTYPVMALVRFIIRRLAPWTDAALAVSQAVRHRGIHEFAIPSERIEVLHYGHDINRFATPSQDARLRIRTELGFDDTTPIIGLIGRIINTIKGQDYMIRAMPMVLARYPKAILLIVGDGPDRKICQSLVERLALKGEVHFMGQRDDIPDLMATMDVLAMPSLSEAFGLVALEAAAAGRPVVAFRTDGIPEIVVHGETGLLVPKGNVDAFAYAVGRVLADRDLAQRLGEGGRQHAQHFTMERHIQRLEEIYSSVVTHRSALKK